MSSLLMAYFSSMSTYSYFELQEENLSESTESLYDDYSNTNVKDILESVILNQKDYSSGNEIQGFTNDDELLFGEEKLDKSIYHNTGPRTERIEKKNNNYR